MKDKNTPDNSEENERVKSKGNDECRSDIVGWYKCFKNFVVTTAPFGQLTWDISRIIAAVMTISIVFLFTTGLFAPLVAVPTGSMEPNIKTGDLVIITEYNPDNPPLIDRNGEIITVHESEQNSGQYTTFNKPGDVIVFQPKDGGTPIIHRAHLWVEEGENWVSTADEEYLAGVESCETVEMCPAPNSGYITAGDNTGQYDQLNADTTPVTEDRVIGVAQVRIPWVGWIRIFIEFLTPI